MSYKVWRGNGTFITNSIMHARENEIDHHLKVPSITNKRVCLANENDW